jgi:glycosyltransferase involved in cell wall biosynthesis
MRFVFVSAPTFEHWDWENPDNPGIGGSETSHVEMSRRIALAGHGVASYAPVSKLSIDPVSGVEWKWSEDFAESRADVHVVYRAPELADKLPELANAWLICQDVDYPTQLSSGGLTVERGLKFSRIIALCEEHARYLRLLHPELASRVCVSSNGIKAELISELLADPTLPARNPRRLMYASSPDRGLMNLLEIFRRAKENVPDLELHVCYGFDNMDKVIASPGNPNAPRAKWMKETLLKKMDQPGVFHHGRMGQRALLREWLQSGIWCHPSDFPETSCITSMDAQACGAIPITGPLWAVKENVKHGVFIEGDPSNRLVRAHYTLELISMAKDLSGQAHIRETMMAYAQIRFDWDNFAKQWIGWAHEDVERRYQHGKNAEMLDSIREVA